jgi:hypothetical protein
MRKPSGKRRVRSRDLAISTIEFTKRDLDAAPQPQKSFHLALGQVCNEVAILQSLLVQSSNGWQFGSRPEREVAVGTTFLMARLVSGKLHEAHALLNNQQNGRLLTQLWDSCPPRPGDDLLRQQSESARAHVNKYFGQPDALLRKVRNKLASHIDQSAMDEAYDRMPSEYTLADFHTRIRGTTFFGCADTVAALAVGALTGEDGELALSRLMSDLIEVSSALMDFAYGYMLVFCRTYLPREKFNEDAFVLRDVPDLERQRLNFFLRPSASRRRQTAAA